MSPATASPLTTSVVRLASDCVLLAVMIFHAGFGVGSMLAPVLVSWDIEEHNSFHYSCVCLSCFFLSAVQLLSFLLRAFEPGHS